MADYYSAISRAVATLEINTFEDRRAIYNRTRAAQSYQLGKRRFNKADFDGERLMLEDAIRRVEIEATTKRISTEASPSALVQPSDIGPTPMTPLPSVRSWLKRVLYRLWPQGRSRRRVEPPSASPIKHPLISDFDTVVTEAGVNVTFKPTNSTYIFHRRVDTHVTARLGPVSCVGVEHAGRDTEDYPRDEVQNMAQQIASEHVPAQFGQWPVD